jgi:superfamily I DNA/RNA helicase
MISPESWKPTDGIDLSEAGMRIVRETAKNIAVIALPGTGKTELLAQRANYLLETGECPYPWRILAISFKVDAAVNLAQRVHARCSRLSERFDSFTFHAFAKRIIDRFRPILTGADALDADYTIGDARILRKQVTFADLLPLAISILQNSMQALTAVRQTYKFVFLDEFQDCTQTQFKLIELLFAGTKTRLTAVGDPCQAIMNFAGDVLPQIFQSFKERFSPADVERLYINHRSAPRLRRLQNSIVRVLEPASAVPDGSILGTEGEISAGVYPTDDEEASELVAMISAWIAAGVPYHEIGIVMKNSLKLYCRNLTAALDERGIPWRNEDAVQNICAEPLAEVILNFLNVIFDQQQPAAYSRLISALTRLSDDGDLENGSPWPAWLNTQRALAAADGPATAEIVWKHVETLFQVLGTDAIISLSGAYQNTSRLEEGKS